MCYPYYPYPEMRVTITFVLRQLALLHSQLFHTTFTMAEGYRV